MGVPTRLTPADFGWTGDTGWSGYWAVLADPTGIVPFGAVVSAHFQTVRDDRSIPEPARQEAAVAEQALRGRFAGFQGTIQNSFYCSRVLGGAAVTERPDNGSRRLHTVLNSTQVELVQRESDCHLLAQQAASAFSGSGRGQLEIAVDAVYSVMTRVLGAADICAGPAATSAEKAAAIATAQAEYRLAAVQVTAMIQRQARFIYFLGVLAGAVLTLLVGAGLGLLTAREWPELISTPALVAATVFGALGATASVFQRMSSDKLVLDFNAGRVQLLVLGALRPLVGAVLAAVIDLAVVGGVLGGASAGAAPSAAFGLYALAGFTAGFSERWATDMIETAGKAIAAGPAPAPPAAPAAPAATGGPGPSMVAVTRVPAPESGVDGSPQDPSV
jgi:hypothetical protein